MAAKMTDQEFNEDQIVSITETLEYLSDRVWSKLGREPTIHDIAVVMAHTVSDARENALSEGYDNGHEDGFIEGNASGYDEGLSRANYLHWLDRNK